MNNATSFWGRSSGSPSCPADPGTVSATGTCNGNGDGKIAWGSPNEMYFLVHHLYLAGILATPTLTGLPNNTPYYLTPGQPAYSYSFVGSQSASYAELYPANPPNGQIVNGNALQTGGYTNLGQVRGAVAYAEDVWNMDTKMDDGLPNTGNFMGANGRLLSDNTVIESCLVLSGSTYIYNVSNTTLACRYLTVINR